MKLGFYVECKEENGLSICADDPALSDRRWVIGTVAITVRPTERWSRFIDGSEPVLAIHGNPDSWVRASEAGCNSSEFEKALQEAKTYAAAMHIAIRGHLKRLAREEGGA